MAGQNGHFNVYAPEKLPYAMTRYVNETNRLYGVMNKRLRDRDFLAGGFSIADIASYPWIVPHAAHGQKLDEFPHLKRWFETIKARPATIHAYERVAPSYSSSSTMSEEARKILFNQTAASVGSRQ
jgi:GST-like protein